MGSRGTPVESEIYLGGQGDVGSGLIRGITRFTTYDIAVIFLLTKSP